MFAIRRVPTHQSVIESPGDGFLCWKHVVQAMVLGMSVVVLAKWGTGLPSWQDVIASENGPVERMSAALWFMGFSWSLVAASAQRVRTMEWLSVAMFLLLFGLRELDAHRWSTGWNLDKLANYWNPHFPVGEKMVVLGLMVLPCIGVGGLVCLRLWQTVRQAWRAGESWVNHLVLGMLLLVVCFSLDKIGPYTLPLLGVSEVGQLFAMVIEEFLELVLAVFTMISLWPYLQEAFGGYE